MQRENAGLFHGGDEGAGEEQILIRRHFQDALAEDREVAGWGHARCVWGLATAAAHEHQPADADLEELVEIRGGDGEELHSL